MVSKASFILVFTVILIVYWKICEAGLRIIVGRNALEDEFPFVVSLEHQYTTNINGTISLEYHQFCTGAAVTPTWILTAAHCDDDDITKIQLLYIPHQLNKFARYNSYFPKELGHLSPISKVFAHPSFILNKYGIGKVQYDIALYKTENITVSSYGKISAIDYKDSVGHEAFVLGYGLTNYSRMEKPLQVFKGILMKCDSRVCPGCVGMLCILPRCDVVATACPGDSGGPVVHATGIVGVNSLAFAKCQNFDHGLLQAGHPSGIITMVSPLVDWISYIIANETDARL